MLINSFDYKLKIYVFTTLKVERSNGTDFIRFKSFYFINIIILTIDIWSLNTFLDSILIF